MMTIPPKNNPTLSKIGLSGLASLSEWGLILIEGPDAKSFLQNQLTNTVMGLEPTSSPQLAQTPSAVRLVGYCNSKGRLLASGWLASYRSSITDDLIFALFLSKFHISINYSNLIKAKSYAFNSKSYYFFLKDTGLFFNVKGRFFLTQ
jgi:folate-binding Fe-S cluster repair protein YgfZ